MPRHCEVPVDRDQYAPVDGGTLDGICVVEDAMATAQHTAEMQGIRVSGSGTGERIRRGQWALAGIVVAALFAGLWRTYFIVNAGVDYPEPSLQWTD
jgi:hypothetical protein